MTSNMFTYICEPFVCSPVSSEIIATLANLSFKSGSFPSCFKIAQVTPLLKKPGSDKTDPSNYRPISNLTNISKILEKLFLSRIQNHLLSCPNFNQYQSAYRRNHSTETRLLSIVDNICHSADTGHSTLLVSLDLSAAFDTIDHTILLHRLSSTFGVNGHALAWIKSYLSERYQFVRCGETTSSNRSCVSGVPQGSVLGPFLFTIYVSPIAHIADSFGISQRQYADDMQFFIEVSVKTIATAVIEALFRGLSVCTSCMVLSQCSCFKPR